MKSGMAEGGGALGFLGGAFDPIHVGHLRGAMAVLEYVGLSRIDLVPAAQSPLKDVAHLDAEHRLAMLRLAVAGVPGLGVDARELDRPGPSFTVDTLESIRGEYGADRPIVWIVGTDILPALPKWSRWQQLLELAHLVVIDRPGAAPPCAEVSGWLTQHLVEPEWLLCHASGGVTLMQQPLLDIASSDIRDLIRTGGSPRFLLPDSVMEYIVRHDLFSSSIP